MNLKCLNHQLRIKGCSWKGQPFFSVLQQRADCFQGQFEFLKAVPGHLDDGGFPGIFLSFGHEWKILDGCLFIAYLP